MFTILDNELDLYYTHDIVARSCPFTFLNHIHIRVHVHIHVRFQVQMAPSPFSASLVTAGVLGWG